MKKTTILLTIFAVFFAANTFAAKTIDGKKITEVKEWVMKNGKKDRLDKVTKYDAKGNKVEEVEYNKTGDQQKRVTFKYNDKDKCIEESHFNENNKLEKTIKIEYNSNGKKSSEKSYFPNGKLKGEHVFEYELEK
ncbi:MAG: hypothetical protein MJZ24_07675 [Paludibacteraceae bacterium]|nr:hypothetical protein [Candidatus Physcocola equi]MCQ2234594.1 hypothetical protein [Paludibacteraceae bacterium]